MGLWNTEQNLLYFSVEPDQRELWPLVEGLPMIGSILRVLQYQSDADARDGDSGEEKKDEQLHMLAETAAELLADICLQIPKVKPNIANFIFSVILFLKALFL